MKSPARRSLLPLLQQCTFGKEPWAQQGIATVAASAGDTLCVLSLLETGQVSASQDRNALVIAALHNKHSETVIALLPFADVNHLGRVLLGAESRGLQDVVSATWNLLTPQRQHDSIVVRVIVRYLIQKPEECSLETKKDMLARLTRTEQDAVVVQMGLLLEDGHTSNLPKKHRAALRGFLEEFRARRDAAEIALHMSTPQAKRAPIKM